MGKRWRHGGWWAGIVCLLLCGAVVAGAVHPVGSSDGLLTRVWKLGSVRIVVESLAVALSFTDDAVTLDPEEGAPFQELGTHPYFTRIRQDPRTRHFYARGPLDVADYAAMADFLRGSFAHGIPAAWHYQFHVLEMLDAGEEGAEIACGEITRMLIQLAQAGRGHGRRVQLDGHVVAELWSREHGKWVAMDADYDVHFTDAAGTPLSALEIHERVREGRRDELVPHVGDSPDALFRTQPESLFRAYEEGLAVVFYARWISLNLPTWHPGRNPARTAHAYFPEPRLDQRVYFRHRVEDPLGLYEPPRAFR